MLSYTSKERKKESDRLTGERNKIKFIDFRCERGQILGFWKGRRQYVPKIVQSWDE